MTDKRPAWLVREHARRTKIDRDYRALCQKLNRLVVQMEEIGENDMGLLRQREARRFHGLTHRLRLFAVDLVNDAIRHEEITR
jgi:hypothetical protein